MRVPAYLTRSGVFEYEQPNGSVIREWRPPEEVGNADSLRTLVNAPVTLEHPNEKVTSQNFRKYAAGHAEAGTVKMDGDKVSAVLIVQDARLISDIERNARREISCGYDCDVQELAGIVPEGFPDAGKRYDRIQRNIRYNHVAVVEDGRAGPAVRLRLDSNGNQTKREQTTMEKEIIDGVPYEVGTPAHSDARKRYDSKRAEEAKRMTLLTRENEQLRGRCDSLTAGEAKLKQQLAEANSPARLDRMVKIRDAVIRRAQVALGPEFRGDGLTIPQIKLKAVKAYHEGQRFDGKSADYVNGSFRSIPADPKARRDANGAMRLDGANRIEGGKRLPDSLRQPPQGFKKPEGEKGGPSMDSYRQRRDAAEESRHRRPLAVSKSSPTKDVEGYPSNQSSMLETMR